jgi:predicted nucleic-acid-binding protein
MAEVVEKICLNNQEHLIDLVDKIESNYRSKQNAFETEQTRSVNVKLESFLESVSKAELDFLDMVYHNDAQLYGPQRAFCSFSRNLSPEQLIDIKKLIIEEKEFAGSPALQYEKLKGKGLDLLRNGKGRV